MKTGVCSIKIRVSAQNELKKRVCYGSRSFSHELKKKKNNMGDFVGCGIKKFGVKKAKDEIIKGV